MRNFPKIPKKPSYVYKYCSGSRAAQICRDRTFYFAPVSKLNDLYEFRAKSLLTETSESKYHVFAKRLLAEKWCATWVEAIDLAHRMSGDEVESSYRQFVESLTEMLERTMTYSGVTCFSEERNNQRMWGTYGDSHTGACIEFDTSAEKSHFAGHLMPAIYTSSKLNVCPSELMTDALTLDQFVLGFFFCMKHFHWAEEREWRLLLLADGPQSPSDRVHPFEPDAITRIFLGPHISNNDEEQIRSAAAAIGTHIGVFKREIDSMEAKEQFVGVEQVKSLEQLLYWARQADNKNKSEHPDETSRSQQGS
jgi:Protein of unknown function (DUF2971)